MPPPPPPTDCISGLKWIWHRCFHGCCRFHRPPHLKDHPVDCCGFLGVFAIKLLLEVCGAGGAVWGSTEVINWRNDSNSIFFRNLALLAFVVFLIRLYWHAKHWLEHEHDFPYVKIHHRRQHMIHFLQVFSAKFLLQVMGGAGAVWGSSEAIGLRRPETQAAWRKAATMTGILFLIRWVVEIMSYCLLCRYCSKSRPGKEEEEDGDDEDGAENVVYTSTRSDKWILRLLTIKDWNECVTVKFILEVCGACGAVWGFSEAAGLRTESTETVWRPIALAVGAIFVVRWLKQTAQFVLLHHSAHLVTEPMTLQNQSSVQLADQRLHVSAWVGRSQNLGVAEDEEGLQDPLEIHNEDRYDDMEEPSNFKADDMELGDDLLLISTGDTRESYNSCDE